MSIDQLDEKLKELEKDLVLGKTITFNSKGRRAFNNFVEF